MIKEIIESRLAFLNSTLFILEDAGNDGGYHFNIKIVSEKFYGKSRMERHRIIYEALGDLFPNKIHALSIKALTKEEE